MISRMPASRQRGIFASRSETDCGAHLPADGRVLRNSSIAEAFAYIAKIDIVDLSLFPWCSCFYLILFWQQYPIARYS